MFPKKGDSGFNFSGGAGVPRSPFNFSGGGVGGVPRLGTGGVPRLSSDFFDLIGGNVIKEVGGYDYEFVEPLPEECICPICKLVQREAHQVICCGKIYCKSCLEQLKKKGYQFLCPNCRASLKGVYKFFPDKNTISKIKHLRIHCTNKERGCEWVGHLKDLDQEHLLMCPNEIVFCSNVKDGLFVGLGESKCGARVQRHRLKRHVREECPWRQIACPFCQISGSHNFISGRHIKDECPEVLLSCANECCHEKVKRRLMVDHCGVCPKEIVTCQYRFLGCNVRLKREDTSNHDQECVTDHLSKAVTAIGVLQREVEDLRSQVRTPAVKITGLIHEKVSFSLDFYIFRGGYKIKLRAYKRTSLIGHEILYLNVAVVPGEYDDLLEWPAKGKLIITLLNQQVDEGHKEVTSYIEFKEQVEPPKKHGEWISVGSIDLPIGLFLSSSPPRYLSDGTAYFRVTFSNLDVKAKQWLV